MLLFEERVGKLAFLHAITDSLNTFARHSHMTQVAQRIDQVIIAGRPSRINGLLVNWRHKTAGTLYFQSVWKEFNCNLRPAETV